MKSLKFVDELVSLVLSGKKDTTWRLFDDKDLKVSEIISLLHAETKEEFARAKVISVKETTFGNLTEEDRKGHETFSSHEELLKTYSGYYNTDVTDDTILKIVKFRLLEKVP